MEEIWKDIPNYEGIYQASTFSIVRDEASSYYGKFCVLVKEGEAQYLTVEELYEFWKSNPDWVENVYQKRIGQ